MAYEIQWMTMGGGAALTLESVTSTGQVDYRTQGNAQSLAGISVPNNAVVVVLSAYDPDAITPGVDTTTVSSTTLSNWTERAAHCVSTNQKVSLWTATNTSGSTQTETITVLAGNNARQGAFTVAVLSGADLTALSNAVATTGTPAASTAFGLSVTRAKSGSYLLAVANANWGGSGTPDAGYTETLDLIDGSRGVMTYTLRSTDPGSGTATIGGDWVNSVSTIMAAIEIGPP